MYNLSHVLVVLVFSSDIGTELVTIESTIETTRRGGSSRYRRCRCCTLLYLPGIFRLRTETIWVSAILGILITPTFFILTFIMPKVKEFLFRKKRFIQSRNVFDKAQLVILTPPLPHRPPNNLTNALGA